MENNWIPRKGENARARVFRSTRVVLDATRRRFSSMMYGGYADCCKYSTRRTVTKGENINQQSRAIVPHETDNK